MLFRSALLLALICPLALSPTVHAQGQALQFDGVDDLAFVLDSSDDFDFGSALSLEAWVRVDTPQPNAGLLGTNADCGLVATMSSPGAATVITPIGAGSFSSAGSANSLPTGTWTHVCGTYDGSTIRTYVNGELRAIRSLTGSTPNTAALLFGVRNQTNYFAGVLDEVRFWNVVRTPLEIRQTWDRELAGNEAGLVGYYKFDAAGQDVIDSSPFGNDGLLGLTDQVEPEDPQRVASGISFRVDSVEEALFFDGVDDICTFLNAQGDFDLGASCTLQAWVRPESLSGNRGIVSAGGQRLFASRSTASFETAAQNTVAPLAPQILTPGEWTHLAGTYDGMAVRLYANGVLQDTLLNTGTAAGSGPALILGRFEATAGSLHGAMDDVSIWNVARTGPEVLSDAGLPLTGTEPGLVGYYRFNEGAGQVLLDSSAAGNDGFLGASSGADAQDPQRIPTEFVVGQNDAGGALLFDGVDDLCFIADAFNDFDFDSAFTMEAWVRVDTAQPNAGIVTTDGDSGLVGVAGGQNAATIVVPDGDTFFQSAVGPSLSLPTGTWTHHAGSFDGTTMRVYSNGQLVGSNDLNSPPESVEDATALIFGYRTNVFDVPQPFAGALDEVRIWSTVRSDAEIALTALCPPIFPQTSLVGYYKFDEGFGQRIEDSSGYQNHGWLGADGLVASDDPVRIASDAPACLAPANDLCLDATDVSLGGVFTGSLIGANREVSSPCDSSSTTADIWFVYTPTSVGNLTLSTCGTNDLGGVDQGVDTVLSLHRFCDGDLIACNDDDMGCASGAQGLLLDSRVTTQVLNGQSVWIRVTHAERTPPGPIQLEVEFEGGSFLDLCNGDGGDQMGCTNCPCGNDAIAGTVGGCLNQAGTSTRLLPAGSLSVSATSPSDLSFDAIGGNPFTFAILVSGDNIGPLNTASPCFGTNTGISGGAILDGLRCVVGSIRRHGGRPMDAMGNVGLTTNGWGGPNGPMPNIATQSGFVPGQTRYFQVFYRTDVELGCQLGQNTSQAVGLTFEP